MDTLLARFGQSAVVLVALLGGSGCSSLVAHAPRQSPELNPSVKGRPRFSGSAPTYQVSLDVRVTEPPKDIKPGHTWSVEVRAMGSDHDVLSSNELAQLESSGPMASRPDLMSGHSSVNILGVGDWVATSSLYYIVVVDVFEMAGDEIPAVYATNRYCYAFPNGVTPPNDVDIPACAHGALPGGPAGSAWGAYVPSGVGDPSPVLSGANLLIDKVPETFSNKTQFEVRVYKSSVLQPTSSTSTFCLLVKVEETNPVTKVLTDTVYLAQWFTPVFEPTAPNPAGK